MSTQLTQWHRDMAASVAAAHPLTPTVPVQASGNSLAAQNDEPEPGADTIDVDVEINLLQNSPEWDRRREERAYRDNPMAMLFERGYGWNR